MSLVAAVLDRAGGTPELAQAVNLGPSGMSLVWPGAATVRPAATSLTLRFQLPGSSALIEVAAEVVFDQPQGAFRTTGVRFAALEEGDERRIADYLAASSSR